WSHVARAVERALEMNPDHGVEVGLVHLHQRLVTDDAGVVDEDVDLAEGIHRRLHDLPGAIELDHGVEAGYRGPTGRLDLLAHLDGRALLGGLAREAGAHVVDHHLGSLAREAQGDLPPDAPSGTGHDGNTI